MSRWKLAALAAAVATLVGCANSTAEVNQPDAFDQLQADPALVRGAEQALDQAPAPEPGWAVGVILAEQEREKQGLFAAYDTWTVAVLAADGSMAVLTDDWCDDDPRLAVDVLPVLVAPGDLITWTGGPELCIPDVRVLRKAAAFLDDGSSDDRP
jgi:hypothetical protein